MKYPQLDILALFQSTLSVRRATKSFTIVQINVLYFNPRSPWGERPIIQYKGGNKFWISIHALREESDRGGWCYVVKGKEFQSTLSVRRATPQTSTITDMRTISIHALREESDTSQNTTTDSTTNFNPRSPWGERRSKMMSAIITFGFQSTLSVRRATWNSSNKMHSTWISIHALREESDRRVVLCCQR